MISQMLSHDDTLTDEPRPIPIISANGVTDDFPFKRVLSLTGLIRFWESVGESNQPGAQSLSREVLAAVADTPELSEPIVDLNVLVRNREAVNRLMSAAFPWAYWDRDIAAAFPPFMFGTFYSTPRFDQLFLSDDRTVEVHDDVNHATLVVRSGLTAYLHIARFFYNLPIEHG
ncbi:MAG: hypothetical protein H7X80_07865, partial [bacterium]|nr:hypothetical protein [Candidatus Kapabacteria bacterium]